mgnify:CR=1 FL=1
MTGLDTIRNSAYENKKHTRQRILNAATEIFSEKGYHGTAVDDIVKASNSSKGSFYFHFPSKQEIFFSLIDRFVASLISNIEIAIDRESGIYDKINAALGIVFNTIAKHRSLARILLSGGMGLGKVFDEKLLDGHARLAGLIKRYLDLAIEEGSIEPMNTEVMAYAWFGSMNEVVIRWLYSENSDFLDQAFDTVREMLLSSINTRK